VAYVPYRFNRAVIFDSDLFHTTPKLTFGSSYEDRRVNVTFLFGERHASIPAQERISSAARPAQSM
jgi:hypothetical protein